jgi:hypothetical protein
MSQRFFVSGHIPDLNQLIDAAKRRRGGWSAYAMLKDEWSRIVTYAIKKAKLKPMARASIHYRWQEKNKRRDPDNVSGGGRKLINDGLVRAGILKQDGWAEIAGFTDEFVVEPKQVGVLVTLT